MNRALNLLAIMVAAAVAIAIIIFATLASACDIEDEQNVRYLAGRHNPMTDPRRVESEAARRSLNELLRDVTGDDREHGGMWWAELRDGGLLIVGSEGARGCGVMQVPPQAWPIVKTIIEGRPI